MPTSPRTSRRLRALALVTLLPLVIGLTALPGRAVVGPLERRGPASHLLAPDRMPTPGSSWSDTTTTADDVSVLGPCHLTSLVDIGALSEVRRTWSTTGSVPRAVQVVAKFADSKSAWRAHQVLGSWQEDCDTNSELEVGPMRTVSVSTGVGRAYWVGRGGRATDLGIVRKGAYLSVVTFVASPDQLPDDSSLARAAVRRIARTF